MHGAPENLLTLMNQTVAASSLYVLAIEYASETEEMVEYRGHRDRLWRRPYGKLYEGLGCKILHEGEAVGFDQCQYWLCERPWFAAAPVSILIRSRIYISTIPENAPHARRIGTASKWIGMSAPQNYVQSWIASMGV